MKNNYLDSLSNLIYDGLLKLRGGDFYVAYRGLDFSFLHTFSDTTYEYNKGIFLIERFYKKNYCMDGYKKMKFISEEDQKKINKFREFADNIPNVKDLSEEEIAKVTADLDKHKQDMNNVTANYEIMKTKQYDNMDLISFDSIDDETLKIVSENQTFFLAGIFAGLANSNIEKIKIGISSVNHDEYIDIIAYMIKE